MKSLRYLCLFVVGFLATCSMALAQENFRGGWVAEVDGTLHIYIFKLEGDTFTGTYCSPSCDEIGQVSLIRDGTIEGDHFSFSLFNNNNNNTWQSRPVTGSITSTGLVIQRGVSGNGADLALARMLPTPRPAVAAAPAPPPPEYVAPGPAETLRLVDVLGKWIAGSGPRAQILIFKEYQGEVLGLVCGPCDNPNNIAPIEDGTISGSRFLYYTVHEDWGGPLSRLGPYRNVMDARVSKNQMRLHGYVEGEDINGPDQFDMTLIGPITIDRR